MKLRENIKVKIGDRIALAIYPNIYLPRKVFENLKKEKPNPKYLDILRHEEMHIKEQKKMGTLKWLIKYIFSPKFRFNEEIIAIKAQKKFDLEKSAKVLSGRTYLWMASYEEVKEKLS